MYIEYEVLRDKIMGCWLGKNAGGALGAPYESIRGYNDVTFYEADYKGNPPPNDDLDLQLVWLNAAERYGRNLDAAKLGEYWLSYIIPDWVEYGSGKTNMRNGLMPPISGHLGNSYGESNGSFIRSDIWACLCPGHPEEAAKLAYEDAIVDHYGDAVYAEVFLAAVESAAFAISDTNTLIDIGLSHIPEKCGIADVINYVRGTVGTGMTAKEVADELMKKYPGTFGIQWTKLRDLDTEKFPITDAGKDVVNNIGITMIGWLYGKDFGDAICLCTNFGEDTDCTAATVGAILGIINGAKGLPKKWIEPLGNVINTFCINMLSGITIPKTIDELTDRILRMIPQFLNVTYNKEKLYCVDNTDKPGYTLETLKIEDMYCPNKPEYLPLIAGAGKKKGLTSRELCELGPNSVKYSFPMFYAIVTYVDGPYIKMGEPKKIKLRLMDSGLGIHQQYFANIKMYTDEGTYVVGGGCYSAPLQNLYKYEIEKEFEIVADTITSPQVTVIIDISLSGRHTSEQIKLTLLAE